MSVSLSNWLLSLIPIVNAILSLNLTVHVIFFQNQLSCLQKLNIPAGSPCQIIKIQFNIDYFAVLTFENLIR